MSRIQPLPIRAVVSVLLLTLAGLAPHALAQGTFSPPERLTFQGFLADGNGEPLGNTNTGPRNYDVIFRIMDAQTGGATNWTEQQTVTVDQGNFSVLLGEGTRVGAEPQPPLSSLFGTATASDRYVEMTVKGIGAANGDVVILPRLRLLSSPYAFLAKTAVNAANLVSASGTPLVTSSGNAVTVNGSIAATSFSGPLNASLITTGTLANARLDQSPTVTGVVTANRFAGNGSTLTSLNGTNISNSSIELAKLVTAVQQALCPVGTILSYAGDTAPAGWLLCDGTAYGTTTYPALYGVIGFRFGNFGGTSTAFHVPDLRGRFLRGRDGGTVRDPDRGSRTAMNPGGAAGDAVGSIQGDAFRSHTHSWLYGDEQDDSGTGGSHREFTRTGGPVPAPNPIGSTGGTETRPINAYVNYIIKY